MTTNKKWLKYNLMAFISISILMLISNYQILRFHIVMIADAVNGSLPIITFISDSIRHFSLPLWNPMLYYGYPEYSQLGCPNMWYPIVFLLSIFVKNSMQIVNLSYVIHRILAGYFMYSFVKYLIVEKNLKKSKDGAAFIISLICGIFYAYSGFFISNAQHDIILISATWLPFILKYLIKFITKSTFKNFFICIFSLSMALLAGYPGLFIIFFLLIFLIIVFEVTSKYDFNDSIKSKLIIPILKESILKYIYLGIGTVILSSVCVIPFVTNMSGITRGTLDNSTIYVNQLTPVGFLSMLVPNSNKYMPIIDPSMVSCYTGILIIFLIPIMLKLCSKRVTLYLSLSLLSIIMCFGNTTILYGISLKLIPPLSLQRFPTLWRISFSVFLIASAGICMSNIAQSTERYKKIFSSYLKYIILGLFFAVVSYTFFFEGTFIKTKIGYDILNGLIITLILAILYSKLLSNFEKISSRIIVLCLVIFEVLSFNYSQLYYTIASNKLSDVTYISDGVKNRYDLPSYTSNTYLDNRYEAERSPYYSNREIIFNKKLDEEGYSPYIMKDSYNVNSYYYRYKLLQNPIFFLTNNTVSKEYSNTVMKDADLDNNVIFTDTTSGNTKNYSNTSASVKKVIHVYNENEIQRKNDKQTNISINFANTKRDKSKLYALYFENNISNSKIDFKYSLNDLTSSEASNSGTSENLLSNTVIGFSNQIGGYVNCTNTKHYVILPQNFDIKYIKLTLENKNTALSNAKLVELNRETQNSNVKVDSFGNNDIKLTVNSNNNQYLVALQAYHKNWKAYDNGKEIPIYKTNMNFRSVKISKGVHNIEFKFQPTDFYLGFILTCLGYIISIVLIVLEYTGKLKFNHEEIK
ncbi:YfhO family protein [Clostridium felsineum]|uniref:Uncharacterized protein n=1 Tax=Clostridium felsineum TaxID=36839 RepID=A0A1S8L3Z9_9CLOT|nr:YfhO family protein [Clostridium felsineum]URZ07204.1 hypothetical protein CLROS_025370 [Clostridium felsineum]URZ12233.1 hypothetical protein CROST_029500 [Clostridium felsineum]